MKDKTGEFEPLITVPKLAKLIGSSPDTIYKLINEGRLKAVMLNSNDGEKRNWRVSLSAYNEFIGSKK
jgi:excisionase family DNA binding protein